MKARESRSQDAVQAGQASSLVFRLQQAQPLNRPVTTASSRRRLIRFMEFADAFGRTVAE
jgi:hypothetical protein